MVTLTTKSGGRGMRQPELSWRALFQLPERADWTNVFNDMASHLARHYQLKHVELGKRKQQG